MPIPANIDPTYVWLILWFGLEVAIIGVIRQLPKDADFAEDVSRRTYARLGRLNQYLGSLKSDRWPFHDMVGDLRDLLALKTEVDIASLFHRRLKRRTKVLEIARLTAVLEIGAVAAVFISYQLGLYPQLLPLVAGLTFALGLALSVAMLVVAEVTGQAVRAGEEG